MYKNILIIAPHADDEILGCGGSIAKFSRLGYEVFVLVLTNGNEGAPELFSKKEIEIIRNESKIANKILQNFKEELKNFKQVCPIEMLDKLDNPINLKSNIKKVS